MIIMIIFYDFLLRFMWVTIRALNPVSIFMKSSYSHASYELFLKRKDRNPKNELIKSLQIYNQTAQEVLKKIYHIAGVYCLVSILYVTFYN